MKTHKKIFEKPVEDFTIFDLLEVLDRPYFNKKFQFVESIELSKEQTESLEARAYEEKKVLYSLAEIEPVEINILPEDIEYVSYTLKMDIYMAEVDRKKEEEKKLRFEAAIKKWTYDEMSKFAYEQATMLVRKFGKPQFIMDEHSEKVWNMLCLYFTNDPRFEKIEQDVVQNELFEKKYYSLNKPLMIVGGYGSGKSTILRAFAKNKKQCFVFVSAEKIADDANEFGIESLKKYSIPIKTSTANDMFFYQEERGWMIDDIGNEDKVNDMGTKADCIAKILRAFHVYSGENGLFGLHLTTNLSSTMIKERYGSGIWDRFKETHNIIFYSGKSRR